MGCRGSARELPNLPLEVVLQVVHLYAERGSNVDVDSATKRSIAVERRIST
jgi:hypothetical protein